MKIEHIFRATSRPQTKQGYNAYVVQCSRDCARLALSVGSGNRINFNMEQAVILLSLEDDPSIRDFDDYVLRDLYRTITRKHPNFIQIDRDTKEISFSMQEMTWPQEGIYLVIDIASQRRRLTRSIERESETTLPPSGETTETLRTAGAPSSQPRVDSAHPAGSGRLSGPSEGG